MRRLLLAVSATLLLLPAGAGAQCAMCKTALTGSPQGRAMAGSFNRAILVMMAAPYLVAGAFGVALYRRRIGEAFHRRLGRR